VNRDLQVRIFPPAVVEAAGTARAAGQGALEAHGDLLTLREGWSAFRPVAGAAFARMHSAWLAELGRLATELAALGDAAEAAAQDYVLTDRQVFGAAVAG
jgi:hypothetical protein